MGQILRVVAVAVAVIFIAFPVHERAGALELIANGGFETGTFAAWSVTDQAGGSGSFFVTGAPFTPLSLFPTVGPAAGLFYAVSDQTGPGAHTLIQSFIVPAGSGSVILSFDMFVNDQSGFGPIVNPAGLDYTASANQHGRVDILSAAAGPFDTGAGVLANFYLGVDPGANPHPYTAYVFDITGLVGAGGTFQLRFAEVDNLFFFHLGVDNVSMAATAVPEPTSLLLLGSGLLGLGVTGWRRSRRG